MPTCAGERSTARSGFAATAGFAAAAMLVAYLPLSGANGVLGLIGATQHVGAGDLRWVASAFTIALTAAVVVAGALAERYGRRRTAVVGLLLEAAGCLVAVAAGAAATGVEVLWVGQAISGVGAGLVMAATLSLIATSAPTPATRARAITVWAAGNVVGLGVGPFLAGAVSARWGWQWSFAPVALVAVLAAASARWAADPALTHPGRLDLAVLPRRLLAARGFDAAGLAAAGALATVIGTVFVLSLVLADHHVSELGIASRLGLLFLGNAVASLAAAPLQGRFGPRAVLVTGLVVAVVGSASLLGWDAGSDVVDLGWRLLVLGAGCGTVIATSTVVAVTSVANADAARAGTGNTVIRQVGGAVAPVAVGGVLAAAGAHAALLLLTLVVAVAAAAAIALLIAHPTTEGDPS